MQFEARSEKRIAVFRSRSHAIALFNTLPVICIEKVVYMKTGEELYCCTVYQSPRLPRVVLTLHSQHERQDPPNPDERKSTDHQSEKRLYRETCRGNIDYRIPGVPHSTVQQEDTNRKETVKRLIQQFENHPNRDLMLQDFNKTEKINPFSEESKGLITDMCNTEIFELCETSSKKRCPDCALYWEVGIVLHVWKMPAAYRKGIDRWTKNIRCAVNSWLCHQRESFPWCQTWTIYAANHVLQST